MLLISIGMFPISLILAFALLPVFSALVTCSSLGLITLWLSLLWNKSLARFFSVLPICFIPVSLFLAQFLANRAAQEDANYAYLHLDILALQAHLLFPVLVLVLATLVWLSKPKQIASQGAISGTSLAKLPRLLLAVLAILGFWALAAFSLVSTQDYLKRYLVKIRIDSEHVIESDNRNPLVVAICAGQIDKADNLLTERGKNLGRGDLDHMIASCLKKRGGDMPGNKWPRFYGDRVEVVLKAILAYENANSVAIKQGCSEYRSKLLEIIYENHVDETALQAFQKMGLPVNCEVRLQDGKTFPAWWLLVHSAPMELTDDKLMRLEKFGVSLLQTDSHGHQFLSDDTNYFHEYADDSALLHLIRRGLNTNFIKSTTAPLSIEVMRRRFGIRYHQTETKDFATLAELVGEPDLQQLLDVKAERWYGVIPKEAEKEAQSKALLNYIDERIQKLEAQKK